MSDKKYNKDMPLKDRPLALIDIETTGLDELIHEIIDIGVLLVKQDTFDFIDGFRIKIKPENIERASPVALEINGYNEEDWKDAMPLREAMVLIASRTVNAMPGSWNVGFEQRFLNMAMRKTGIQLQMDYHWIDLPSIIWFWDKMFNNSRLGKLGMDNVAKALGVEPEPKPHNGESGVLQNYKLLGVVRDKAEKKIKK